MTHKYFSLMTKLSNISGRFFAMAILASVASAAFAQDYYYDDDIYYDASKAKKEQKKQIKKQASDNTRSSYIVTGNAAVADYAPADSYSVPASSLNVDVDTYNRRGQFLVQDSVVASDDNVGGDFAYTQRIKRFHNPDVVSGSGNEELKEVYSYAMQQPQNINVYVIDTDPWGIYGPSWSWRFGSPWYLNSWYPSYGWGWNSWAWDPYWSWGWGPSWSWGPSWGWGHGWGPAWGPSWGPSHAWRPTTPSGSSRPHNYVGSGSMATHRPGSGYTPSATNRPGNMGRGRYGSGSSVTAPSGRPGNYRPAGTGSGNNSGVNSSRPGNSGRGRSTMNNSNNYNTNNRNSYNTNSKSNYRTPSSSGSFRPSGGGSRGYSGSHGTSTGGGGGRGRR